MFDNSDPDKQIACSFCGKTQDQVKKIVAGPGVYICNECIDLCKQIIDDEKNASSIGRNQCFNPATDCHET